MFAAIAAAAEEPQSGSLWQEAYKSSRGNNRKGDVRCSQVKGEKANASNTEHIPSPRLTHSVPLYFLEREL